MMRRAVLAALCGTALILTPVAVAYGQDVEDSQECTDSRALVVTAQAEVDGLTADLAVLVESLDGTRVLLAAAVESARPYFQGEVARLEGVVAALRVRLATANAALAVAVGERDTDCTPPVTPTPTPTPTATPDVTTSPAPTSAPDGDDDFDQVRVVPRGGVATGG